MPTRLPLLALFSLAACQPGPHSQLELTLDQSSTVAGQPVAYVAELVSPRGQRQEVEVELRSDLEPDLSFDGASLTPVRAGSHQVLAVHEDLETAAPLVVEAGLAASLVLALDPALPEVGERVQASATLADAWGNAAEADWTLTVEAEQGADAATVSVEEQTLTFTADGVFTVLARAEEEVEDAVGPLLVDSHGPEITITTPQPGAWLSLGELEVAGSVEDPWSGVETVSCDGRAQTLQADGSFSTTLETEDGLRLVRTEAVDGDGNEEVDLRSVIAGRFADTEEPLWPARQVRLGSEALAALGSLGDDFLATADLEGSVDDPFYDDLTENCLFGICVTTYALTLHMDDPSLSSSDVVFAPSAPWVTATAILHDVEASWSAEGVLVEVPASGSGTLSASALVFDLLLLPRAGDGTMEVLVEGVSSRAEDLDLDLDGWMGDAASGLGVDASILFEDALLEAAEEVVVARVRPILENALQDLCTDTQVEAHGVEVLVDLVPVDVEVEDQGLTLTQATAASTTWRASVEGQGWLDVEYPWPAEPTSQGQTTLLSANHLSQLLYASWGGGLLTGSFTTEELGLDPEALEALAPEVVSPRVELDGLLPPVLLAGTGDELLDLQLGEVGVRIVPEAGGEGIELRLGLTAGVDLDAELVPTLVVRESWCEAPWGVDAEVAADLLVPAVLDRVEPVLAAVPVPGVSGLAEDSVEVGVDGGWLAVSSTLVAP